MKMKLFYISIVMAMLPGLTGCPKPMIDPGNVPVAKSQKFPDFLVGSWQTDSSKWRFIFDSDGRISSLTHYGGMVFDVEKGFLTEKWGDKIEANFFLGPCEAKYDPQSRELSVKVVIENFVLDDGVNTMEGNFHDQLIGTISKDGKTWQTTWTSKGGITGSGTDTPEPRELTFTKTSGEIKIEEN